MPERVRTRVPTRIDLAGGTIDLWPLYLLHDEPLTVNAAIDLHAEAVVEEAREGVEIVSVDRGRSARFESVESLRASLKGAPGELEFPMRLAAHFLGGAPGRSCRITTACQAPAGSGLGGSSALGIALAAALDRFTSRGMPAAALLSVTRSIETQVLRIPTGEQDYHPAVHGGALALNYTVEGTRVERLEVDLDALRERIVLVFTGVSRSSGTSNWDMLKRHLDGDPGVRSALEGILDATRAMRRALVAADWDGAGRALAREWEARKRMSPAVTSDVIEDLIEKTRPAGALAGKVCGAGGGGCVVLWCGAGRRDAVAREAGRLGGKVLDVRFVPTGLSVTDS